MGGETYAGSDPKEVHKSDLQTPPEPHNEEENKATPLRCEPENLVEEQDTKVSVQKHDNMKKMDRKISYFCSSHEHPQPSDSWEDKKSSLASEDYKMQDNCEGDEITLSFYVGHHKTITKYDDVFNGDEGYFLSKQK